MSAPDLHLARRMLYACVCAYNVTGDKHGPVPVPGADRVVTTTDGYSYSVVNAYQAEVGFAEPPDSYTPAFYADGDHDIDAALVGVTHDGFAVVALRGTLPPSLHGDDLMQWVDDWANDARIKPVDWSAGGGAAHGKAESGFAKATHLLWQWIEGQVDAVLAEAPNGVLITGHSKGGAMCYLVAALVQARWPELGGKIAVHAFAPAVSVDVDFVAAYDAAGLAAQTTRYMVAHDVVPFLPKWTAADIWTGTFLSGFKSEATWLALGAYVAVETDGGYAAPGALVYFDAARSHVTAPDALDQALAQVVAALQSEDFKTIGGAHSVTDSYALCFPPVVVGPAVTGGGG
jgi:hypothetical protein